MPIPLLEGYSALEITETPGGAFCAKLLADMGADLLKVEPPGGDASRNRGAFPKDIPDAEASGLFLFLNTNKRGITLNLGAATGREIAARLAERVDAIVEDLPPGSLAERGLGYEKLRKRNPRLVMVSLTPFGQTGPKSGWKAQPLTTYHAGGHAYHLPPKPVVNQFPDRPPVAGGRLVGEYQGAVMATLACIAALVGREVLGGQHVEVSKQEALINIVRTAHSRYPNEGVVVSRRNPGVPYVGGMLPCRDGWVQCVVMEEHQWTALMELLGHPEWERDPRLASQPERVALADEVHELLAAETRGRDVDEIYSLGQALGCPIGKVLTAPEVLASEQLAARQYFSVIDHPFAGSLRYPSLPFAVSSEPRRPDRSAPTLGEHNSEVLAELGFDEKEIARLLGTGVI